MTGQALYKVYTNKVLNSTIDVVVLTGIEGGFVQFNTQDDACYAILDMFIYTRE